MRRASRLGPLLMLLVLLPSAEPTLAVMPGPHPVSMREEAGERYVRLDDILRPLGGRRRTDVAMGRSRIEVGGRELAFLAGTEMVVVDGLPRMLSRPVQEADGHTWVPEDFVTELLPQVLPHTVALRGGHLFVDTEPGRLDSVVVLAVGEARAVTLHGRFPAGSTVRVSPGRARIRLVGCFEGPDRLPGEPFDSLLTQVAVVEGRHGLEVDLRLGPGATGYSRREETSTEIALLFGSAADGLAPLDPKPARTRGEVHRVVLDPTHGGLDGGRRVGGIEEKWLTLELARTLADSLRAQGFEVFLTRNEDRPLSGEERASFANEMNGDLFLSFGIEDFGAMRTPDVRCLVHAPVEAPGRAQVVAGFRLVPWEAAQSIHGEESRSAARWVLHTASSERPLDRDADPAPLRALEGVNMPAVLVLLGPDAVDVATWRISRLHLASGLTEAVLGYAGRDRVRVERFDPFGDPRRGLTPVEHDRRSEDARRDERRQAIRDARGSRRDSRDRRVREGGR